MEKQHNSDARNDLKINGTGKISGGFYNDIVINGTGSIKGDVDCISFKTNGASSMSGNLKSKIIKVNGTTAITGAVSSGDIKVSGTTDFNGGVESNFTKINGAMNVTGNISSDELHLNGGMRVSGDCNAETFDSSGGFSVVGLLNADKINIRLNAPCRAKEIGGENITVKLGKDFSIRKLIKSIFPSWDLNQKLSVDVIEGNDIELEQTKAKIVRGDNVIIGEGCEIELVEYKKSFNQSEKSTVKENKKM
jgi:cytoskeletal protein CcmA (bactofilin family)